MPLPLFTGILGKKNAAHLLRRATFGPTKASIDAFASLTPAQAVDQLFQAIPDPLPPIDPNTGATWVNIPASTTTTEDASLQAYLACWWFGLTTGQGAPSGQELSFLTKEKLIFFFHTHFTTIKTTVGNSRALYYQNGLFRKFAFDGGNDPILNFKNLAKKICIDNAMLILLDGRLNVKGKPNENFAREFLELFTIGKGLPGSIPVSNVPGDYIYFTEQDVQAAAKVFSGYDVDDTFTTIDPETNLPRAKVKMNSSNVASQHDNTIKQFSDRLGAATVTPDASLLIAGNPTDASMLDELDQLINLIFSQAETTKNICRKIYRYYVYHEVTPSIDSTVITEMVNTFIANNYKIEPVIKELLSSQHFYDVATSTEDDDSIGAIIKSPLDLVSGTLRFFDFKFPDCQTDAASFYDKTQRVLDAMVYQGMDFLNPFDVAGYEAYYQYPLFNRNWISANNLTERYKFIFDSMNASSMNPVSIDLLDFIQQYFSSNAMDPDALIRELVSYLFPLSQEGTEITTERLNYFKKEFFKLGTALPQGPLVFWQFSWTNANTIPEIKEDARGMLQDLMNAMLQSPEYQLM